MDKPKSKRKPIIRERRFELLFNEKEWLTMIDNFQKSGIKSLASYVRFCISGVDKPAMKKKPRKTIDEKLMGQTKRIGNNINQLARKVNSGEYSPQSEELLYRLQLALNNMEKTIRDLQERQALDERATE